MPTVKAEEAEDEPEDLVDPQETLRDHCREQKSCVALKEKLDECNDRVNSRSKTTEMCSEELFDFMHCVDGCAAKRLFSFLK
ncbi:hypothetical protein PR048_000744 [Dryococelus australis]|uniref:Cytochrome b-c1 complex subunit 6 n=1 Tax=Dryococelus australis TaxID=614101 RepID=A0ABQ9IFG7_9NEOP|nr:hypothetical protein PR048_000744 [Dryococelus australis]